jgi:hypothetical protein
MAVTTSPGLVVLDNAAVNCSASATPVNILVCDPMAATLHRDRLIAGIIGLQM